MAAPGYVMTISRVAKMLGESEQRLHGLAIDMDPEDGCLSVIDVNDDTTVAFTPAGVEYLQEMLADLKE